MVIMNYMIFNHKKVNTALAALRCITSLTLRNPECARTLVNDQNAAEAIVNALNCHAKNKAATRAGKYFRGKLFSDYRLENFDDLMNIFRFNTTVFC